MSNPPIKPWKRLNRQTVYQNPWITVYEDNIQLPNGHTTIYGVVAPPTDFVGIVPFIDPSTVILVRQYRYIQGAVTWEIPSGAMDHGEKPEEAAQRELREEVGYRADQFQLLSVMRSNKSVMDDKGYIFVAEGLTASRAVPDETEDFEIVPVPLTKALELVKNHEITDCVSLIGLFLAEKYTTAQSVD
ncbi:MAG: NUDIX domain-containing protein [Candidatus Odinarchaeota archaeon]